MAHGVGLGWLVHCADDAAPRRAAVGERASEPSSDARAAIELVPVELAAVEPSLVELVLLPEAAVSGGEDAAGNAGAVGRAAIRTGRGGQVVEAGRGERADAGTGDDRGPGDRPNPLGMRGRRHDLSLSGERIARLLEGSKPLAPPIEPSGLLEGAGRGERHIDDDVATVRVRPDGTVDMKAKADFSIHLALPFTSFSDLRLALGQLLTEWYRDPYAGLRNGAAEETKTASATPKPCDLRGDPMCDPLFGLGVTGDGSGGLPLLSGRMDVTSFFMRKLGAGDAYASRKLKLLDATRAERVQIGAAYRSTQLDRSSELVLRNLEALWRTTLDPAARREALFALWDECTEGEGAAGAAGERARAMVIGWIRTHLPADGPHAFTAAEIARLDAARTSKQRFAPYD